MQLLSSESGCLDARVLYDGCDVGCASSFNSAIHVLLDATKRPAAELTNHNAVHSLPLYSFLSAKSMLSLIISRSLTVKGLKRCHLSGAKMKLTSVNVTVPAATMFIAHIISALPPSSST